MTQRFSRKYVYVVAVMLGGWAVFAGWVVPHLVRQAYRGESLAILNAILSGRSVHPVESYLAVWRSLALTLTVLLVALTVGVCWGVQFPKARQAIITWIVGAKTALDSRTLLWYAAFWGSFGGLAEAVYRAIRQVIAHPPATGFYWEVVWLAPLSAGLAALIIGGVLVFVARAGGTNVGAWKATALFAFIACYSVMQSKGIPLYPASEVIVSLGLASVAARAVAARVGTVERLVLRGRRYLVAGGAVLVVCATLSLPAVRELRALTGRRAARGDLPNILLIILDTVRASNLSLYGYGRPTTPRIDEWAKSGTVFDNALATSPWTLPTHATVFTGRYNYELHTSSNQPLDGRSSTLAEVLADHGYVTAGFVANLVFTTRTSGVARGFDRYEDYPITPGGLVESSWLSRTIFGPLRPWSGGLLDWGSKTAEDVTRGFLRWADKKRDRPFFVFLNYFDAHEPYPLTPHSAAFGPPSREPWSRFSKQWVVQADSQPYSERMRSWVNQYDGALAYIDEQVGVVLDSLRARGMLENAIIVVTSDHGESFGEHGLISHRNSLYLPQLHVPLVISYPGRVPSNTRISGGVTVRDLAATILDLAGVRDGPPIPGASLAHLWNPMATESTRSPLLAELTLESGNDMAWAPISRGDMETLFEGALHYIRNGDGVEELYDIQRDPEELENLAGVPTFGRDLVRLRSRLDSIIGLDQSRVPHAN